MQGDLRNFSRRDYENMIRAGILGEDEHLELVGGRIVVMSPEGPVHAGAIDLCAEILRRTFGPDHTVRVQHPLAIDKDDEPEPDIAVVRGGPRDHLTEHPRDAVLVVEVAESSLAYDRGDKALLYARAGFAELDRQPGRSAARGPSRSNAWRLSKRRLARGGRRDCGPGDPNGAHRRRLPPSLMETGPA